MLNNGEKIIVAVSGGIDSSVLLNLFLRIQNLFDLQLIVAHLNHGLRQNESDDDEKFVADLCAQNKIIFEAKKINVKDFARKNKFSIEEAGRICRYDFFSHLLTKYNADKIATAHNKNDNAETILMKLIRGCGSFSGIMPVNKKIIRPLINIERAQIETYCYENNISYRIDSSNLNCEYTRNKIRNIILPQILSINPNFIDTISRSTKIISDENNFLNQLALKNINSNKISVTKLKSLPQVLQKRIIRIIIRDEISSKHINSIIELLDKPNGKKISLPNNITVEKNFDEIMFFYNHNYNFEYELKLNQITFIPQLNKFLLVSDKKNSNCTKIFYCDNINKITVRNYRCGDKIFFKNFGHKKLKNIFNQNKIWPHIRQSIPLLTVNDIVIWIMNTDIITNYDTGKIYFIHTWEDTNDKRCTLAT